MRPCMRKKRLEEERGENFPKRDGLVRRRQFNHSELTYFLKFKMIIPSVLNYDATMPALTFLPLKCSFGAYARNKSRSGDSGDFPGGSFDRINLTLEIS